MAGTSNEDQSPTEQLDNGGTTASTDLTKATNSSNCCKRCSTKCSLCCLTCCKPCMSEHNPLSVDPSRCQKIKYSFMCPPHGKVGRLITLVLSVFFFWAVVWSITGPAALPGGNFFALIVLVVLCSVFGWLVQLIRLPALLGMLVAGCLLRNVPKVNVGADIDPEWSSALRNIALVVILTRAGLGLDPVALRKLSFGVVRLAFSPCLIETVTVAVASHLLLGFPWTWGFMLGFVLAAVTPAVVVPCMISLQERGLGQGQGIPTLVIAASSIDDVLAISGFGVVLGIAFSTGNIVLTIFRGPLEALAGVVYGIVFGVISWYIPHQKHSSKTIFRFVILFCGGLLATFGSRSLDISGAGALGCLTMAFVAALRWRTEVACEDDMPMVQLMDVAWTLCEPLLFGLIGNEVDISAIELKTIGLGIAVLCMGLVTRSVVAFLSVFGLGLNLKEKIFIPLAWLPKATVQAAFGSIALDTARAQINVNPEFIELGTQVLTIAVLGILITAPLGAIAITLSAPRLLKSTSEQNNQNHVKDTLLNDIKLEDDLKLKETVENDEIV